MICAIIKYIYFVFFYRYGYLNIVNYQSQDSALEGITVEVPDLP